MLLQRAEMSRKLPSGSLGTFAQRESELWLKSPENLPTTKRARREKITVTTINARMAWTCRMVLGALRAADLGPSPAGQKPRLRVRVQGERGWSVLSQSPGLSIRDENMRTTTMLLTGKESILSGQATAKDLRLTTHRGYSDVLDMKPAPEKALLWV